MINRTVISIGFLWGLVLPSSAQKSDRVSTEIPTVYSAPASKQNHCIDTVDLSGIMPPVGDQQNQNSCSAWAVGYACRSYYNANGSPGYLNSDQKELSPSIISPTFIYNSLNNKKRDTSINISTALKLMVDTGACSYRSMPYTVGCNVPPNPEQIKEAKKYRIETFGRLNKQTIVDEIRGQLKNKQPVVIGVIFGKKYFLDGNGWPDTSKYIWRFKGGPDTAGHAVVVVGFDDRIEAIKIMNSAGNKWGNKGFGWISYELAPRVITSAYTIKPIKPIKKRTIKEGSKKTINPTVQVKTDTAQKDKTKLQTKENVTTQIQSQSDTVQLITNTKTEAADTTSVIAWFTNSIKKIQSWGYEKKDTSDEISEVKRTNNFDVKLNTVTQTDKKIFALDINVEINDCACDSYQIAVPIFWGGATDRTKKVTPVLAYEPEYSLANGQASIILPKQEFAGTTSYTKHISIPLNEMAIPKGFRRKGKYIKALNRLVVEAVWYNDDFAIKSFSTLPVDVYY